MQLVRFLFLAAAMTAAASVASAQREKLTFADLKIVEEKWPEAKKTSTGLRYHIVNEGEGEAARSGDLVAFIYRGSFLDGKIFDEDWNRVRPFSVRLGRSQVIQGMDQGLKLMKKGTRMILIVPPDLAYGSRGDLPKIKPHTTLVFELEVIDIQRAEGAPAAKAGLKK